MKLVPNDINEKNSFAERYQGFSKEFNMAVKVRIVKAKTFKEVS